MADPLAALLLASAVACLFGSPRRARRPLAALLGAAAAAAVSGGLGQTGAWLAAGAALGAGAGWLAPLTRGAVRRRDPWRGLLGGGLGRGGRATETF